MKVLLIITDLFRDIGGGQTVYRRIIESAPDIEFFYFREDEPPHALRPRNAHAVPLSERLKLKVLSAPPFPAYRQPPLQMADRFARSVAGQHFDIVDVPDFYAFGGLLRDAFAHHHVMAERIVLAMHGNISVSVEMAWGSDGDNALDQRLLEREQFEQADAAYAISPRYVRQWQAVADRPVHYIDPLAFVEVPRSLPDFRQNANQRPNLYCIGRTERRKGNDLFVEIVRWLNPTTYGKAAHIGDELITAEGVGTRSILLGVAARRSVTIDYYASFNRNQLKSLFHEPCIVILPVRYDTLNLVALEALFEGCPVAVSSEAGVCDYLDSTHPSLPYVKIDFGNFYGAVSAINHLLSNYDHFRAECRERLSCLLPQTTARLDMGAIYGEVLSSASTALKLPAESISYCEWMKTPLGQANRLARRVLPVKTYRKAKDLLNAPRRYFMRRLRESEYLGDARFLSVLADARFVPGRLKWVGEHSERSKQHLRDKLERIYNASTNPLFRCNFWLDIARIERILGDELIAVTYELRALRLLGRDAFGVLPRAVQTLATNGLELEAEAVRCLYADKADAAQRTYTFLKKRYESNLRKSEGPYELLDDRRQGLPRVAVIVSLYNAASKLRQFLTAMVEQTLVKQGEAELIFIDSGSPDQERTILDGFWRSTPLNAVYARSQERETIQAAWNRGIELSRAPYLVFLGVDEALYPDALETLARELDREPAVDWVMGNSLVTAVDEHGIHKKDIMSYDRAGATKDYAYLETCYLSWVGGMYRKSIHDRFGYYDETFRAAGDTEFKNRVLPHINVKFVLRTLGLFLNYPESRTTASTRAEIEDLRAWYIHRTPGGLRYAFEQRPQEDLERLLYAALGYRKSYCVHLSSDAEYAAYLAAYLSSGSAAAARLANDVNGLLRALRDVEYVHRPPSCTESIVRMMTTWREAARLQQRHRVVLEGLAQPTYKILNDNRYEQHSWLWRTGAGAV